MSDVTTPPRPLLHPVLALRISPAQKDATGGGKQEKDVVTSRLTQQRRFLSEQVSTLRTSGAPNVFGGQVILVAEMFDDSFATTKAPRDLFRGENGILLRGAARDGYLVEIHTNELRRLEQRIRTGESIAVRCDISRVKNIRPYGSSDIYRDRDVASIWDQAPAYERGRAFFVWLTPFRDLAARTELLGSLDALQSEALLLATAPRMLLTQTPTENVALPDISERQNSLAIVQREYLAYGRGRALVEIPSLSALRRIVASGGVFRIEPVQPISITAPGEGEEPQELPASIITEPIVGHVDGGCTARRYDKAVAWRESPYVSGGFADTRHGNQVASVIIHGHEWNNNLPLPELYSRIGVVQAIARTNAAVTPNPARFISYLESVIRRHSDTHVWNLSWNEREAVDPVYVSALGHDLALLARRHNVLFVVSAGNVSTINGNHVAPPADCEAALVVGARQFDDNGMPGKACPETLPGYGPEFQLVPQVTSFSPLRLLGGGFRRGTSFPTGLISSLAGHTFENLREPTPDLVRALIINRTDLPIYDRHLGWGTPSADNLPWHCAPGTVTLAFKSNLKAGVIYHWNGIPIPRELVRNNKLYGFVSLITVHRPLCNANGGPSYIATRVGAAVQYPDSRGEFKKLVGSKELDDTLEIRARSEEYKWQPLRREVRDFTKRGGLDFDGRHFRLYARLFARDIAQFDYQVNADIPEIETVFVVTFSDGSNSSQIYNTMAVSLGNFVESAVLNQDIEIEP